MNTVEKAALKLHKEAIVDNVDFVYIKDKLLAYKVINLDELETIECEKINSAKVRKLLDLLPLTKDKNTFKTLVKIFESDYKWLADTLEKANNSDSPDASGVSHSSFTSNNSSSNPFSEAPDPSLVQRSLILGGVPFPPPHLIPRSVKISEIRQCLKEMSPGHFVVLSGMAGAGKSVLAAESVRDADLVLNTFDNNVFWLTLGQTEKDTLLTKMQSLCERLDHTLTPPLSVDQATERLRRLMMEPKRKNSLLILDDVWRGEVVRAFDFGCRVLMTTRDASVAKMVNGRALVIKIQDGFTHAESIKFLADYLGIDQDELPEQANQIYSESKGSPMVLSLLAPLLAQRGNQRQQLVIDTGRWDHYLGKLRDRRYSQLRRNSSYNYETINEAIAISFGDLDDDTRALLNNFVIFLDDVNIPAPVLQVLWQCSPYELEEKIGVLVAKSLIAYHQGDHTSASSMAVYGIHDLVLDYLKSHVSAEEQLATHRKLIDAYLTECQGDYGALPDDNYIFWFLGYHLYKAERTHLFPQIYLNLHFISAKLRACQGSSDLLNDLRKYQDFISGLGGEHCERLEDYARFIRTCGNIVVQCPLLDIVQLALQQPTTSAVYRDALEMASHLMNKKRLYFKSFPVGSQRDQNRDEILRSTILNYGHVTAACFTQDGRRLLSAIGDGQIRMWDVDSGKELHRYTGHNGSVHQLSLSTDAKRFVSCSADGSSKVWDLWTVVKRLDDAEQRPTKTPSPRMRQDSWHNMFDVAGRVISDDSEITYTGHTNEVCCARFSDNGALIVSGGHDRTARIWMSTAGMELAVLKHPESVSTCCFSKCGFYIATGCTDSSIRIWNFTAQTCVVTFHDQTTNPRIIFLSFLSTEMSLLSVSDTEIRKLKWALPTSPGEQGAHSYETLSESNSDCCYQCAAISDTNSAGQMLAVATSKDNILIFDVEEAKEMGEFIGHTGSVTSLHFSPPLSEELQPVKWLLSGSLDETLKVWNVCNVQRGVEDVCSLSSTAFYADGVSSSQAEDFYIACARSDNRIQVINGSDGSQLLTTEAETINADQVEQCCLSSTASLMAWSTLSGLIKLVTLKNKEKVKVLGHHSDSKVTLLKFSPSTRLVLSASSEGCIKIWKPEGGCVMIDGPRKAVVDCLFIEDESTLMICGGDGSVRLWSVDSGTPTGLLLMDSGLHVTCVDKTVDNHWLAQGTTNCGLQLVQIQLESKKPMRQPTRLGHHDHSLESPVRICRFADGQFQYLAVGYDSGTIEVFDYTRHVMLASLRAHESWVRDLRWCRKSPFFQLVSIGDRIAFWDLSSLQKKSSFPSIGLNRVVPLSSQNLVQTVEFQGHYASKVFLSDTGRIVTTVTDSGVLYILRQLTD